jgi:8-oxo-dGTP pyrophosphatase MutT (NUDIX family)
LIEDQDRRGIIRLSQYIGDLRPDAQVKGFCGLSLIAFICSSSRAIKSGFKMDINAQKYKIWINASWMIFMTPGQFKKLDFKGIPTFCLLQHPSLSDIRRHMDDLWSGRLTIPVIISDKNAGSVWKKLLKKTPLVYAAGGLVQRPDGKFLFIHRRGWWDLPKGKLDKGETNKMAAIREVKEEVGLDAKIVYALPNTYHCYTINDRLVIKVTAWYLMITKQSKAILQTEEDIIGSKWVSRAGFKSMKPKLYANLKVLISAVKEI